MFHAPIHSPTEREESEPTWIFESEVRLRLGVALVEDVLAHVLGEDLVEDVVDGEGEAGLVLEQLLHQEGVEVVGIHHIIPGQASSPSSSSSSLSLSSSSSSSSL